MRASALLVCLLAACGPTGPDPTVAPPPRPRVPVLARTIERSLADVGLDASAIERSIDPCDDFYQYACGGWLRQNRIPDDETAWLRSIDGIRTANEAVIRRILDSAAASASPDVETRALGDFHAACMDEAAVQAAGIRAIEPLLAKIRALRGIGEMAGLLAESHESGAWPLFRISVRQDAADATRWIANLEQSGLGLPDRELYLLEDAEAQSVRKTYATHVARMFELAGLPRARAKQAAVETTAIETQIAKVSLSAAAQREPKKLVNRVDRGRLSRLVPQISWDAYFAAHGLSSVRELNVTSVELFEGLGLLLSSVRLPAWQSYLSWHAIRGVSQALPEAFARELAKMDQALAGQTHRPPRWRLCTWAAEELLPHLVARRFVEARFGAASERAIEALIAQVRVTMSERLSEIEWMDAETRSRAVAKLGAMIHLVGHPQTYDTYDVALDRRTHAKNMMALRALELRRTLAKAGKPVDRREWTLAPAAVNASYDPQRNQALFPAGILQPPLFSERFSTAVNLGGIGIVIGHEMTHAFDDEGSQFDASGRLGEWWAPATRREFEARTACVEAQYGSREALPGVRVDGRLTLGENIADMGGVKLAYRAYRAIRARAGETVRAEGFDEDQQFFLAVGQTWCGHFRPELERLAAQSEPQAPVRLRVVGPLSNMPEFWRAFSCAEGSAMRPASPCSVW